jgi:Rieske Fe-S protein
MERSETSAEAATPASHCEGCALDRRALLTAALGAGLVSALAPGTAKAEGPARPQPGDHFVFASGDKEGTEITPADLAEGAPQVLAWPMDPTTKKPRDGSRLAQVLLIRLDPASLDEETKPHAADGIVAYAATCSHAQCPVLGWNAEKKAFHCHCHNSEYDPRHDAKVVFGPAPRPLPALPLKLDNGALVAAGTFLGRVGTSSS